MTTQLRRVSFHFGPFDGHSQHAAESELQVIVALPVSKALVAWVARNKGPCPSARPERIAFYELRGDVYYFVGYQEPSEAGL